MPRSEAFRMFFLFDVTANDIVFEIEYTIHVNAIQVQIKPFYSAYIFTASDVLPFAHKSSTLVIIIVDLMLIS